jgi:CHAT domain-containing protein
VLAACSTGGGRVRSGDEVLGLPRALLLAGAGMVVITYWDVDAETSFDIMARFYTNLAKGSSVAAALREARSYARKSGLQTYHWAPFVLVGNHGFRD